MTTLGATHAKKLKARSRVEPEVIVGDGRQHRFGKPNDPQRNSKLLLHDSLVIEEERKGRAGHGGE